VNYRLFHGSPVKGLTSLRPSSNRSFPVIYFSDEPNVAATYTRGRGKVYPATVTMNRPLVMDAEGRDWENAGGRNVSTDTLAARAYATGHDGIILKNVVDEVDEEGYPVPDAPPNNIYAVFDAAQVKLTRRNPLVGPRPAHRVFTESPAFKRWFGKSVLVREDGDPLVLLHGTDKDFSVFEKVGSTSLRPLGFWFTDDSDNAEAFGDRLMPVYLRVENPYYADLKKMQERAFADNTWARRFREELIAKGHDGIIVRPTFEQVGRFTVRDPMLVCVFDPRQVKSAVGNSGAFDILDPDITRNPSGRGRNGRRAALKMRFPRGSASSSLAAPTTRHNGVGAAVKVGAKLGGRAIPFVGEALMVVGGGKELAKAAYRHYKQGFDIKAIPSDVAKVGAGVMGVEALVPEYQRKKNPRRSDAQTSTPAFRAWFGASKVVDEAGKPLVVYHGTGTKFTEFKYWRPNFFSMEKAYAEMYADKGTTAKKKGFVMPVFLRMERPFDPSRDAEAVRIYNDEFLPMFRKIVGDAEADRVPRIRLGEGVSFIVADDVWAFLRDRWRLGDHTFDGLLVDEGGFDEAWAQVSRTKVAPRAKFALVPLFPTQIKSATKNEGTFAPNDPNIYRNPKRKNSEDYHMRHRPPEDGPLAHELWKGEYVPEDILQHPEWYTGFREYIRGFWPSVRVAQKRPKTMLRIYRALPKPHSTFREGDWVTLSRAYAQVHLDGPLGGEGHIIMADVPADTLRFAGDDLMEWGYWGPTIEATPGRRRNPKDLKGRSIPERYLAGLPPAVQKARVRELTRSRDAYKKGDYSELPSDRIARQMGLVKKSAYSEVAESRGIEWRGDEAEMARRVCAHYKVKCTPAVATAIRSSFNKGLAAWKSGGHRPGATAQNWAVARVASLVVGGKTSLTADRKDFASFPAPLQKAIAAGRPDVVRALLAQGRENDAVVVGGA
jgi:hypothetical protein